MENPPHQRTNSTINNSITNHPIKSCGFSNNHKVSKVTLSRHFGKLDGGHVESLDHCSLIRTSEINEKSLDYGYYGRISLLSVNIVFRVIFQFISTHYLYFYGIIVKIL